MVRKPRGLTMTKGGLSTKPVKGYAFKSYNHERKKEMDEKMAKLRAARKCNKNKEVKNEKKKSRP